MIKIQVIGLPGAGKTTAIREFLQEHKAQNLTYIDIRTCLTKDKERVFRSAILNTHTDLIAESACGIFVRRTLVIRLQPPIQQVYQQCRNRDGSVDIDYLSLIAGQMVYADYTINTGKDLPGLLETLFKYT